MRDIWYEIVANFHFLRPWILLFLLILPVLYFMVSQKSFVKSGWERVCDKSLLRFLLIKDTSKQNNIKKFLIFVSLLSAIIAAAGPAWKKAPQPTLAIENPLMILLNLSSDMRQKDVHPDRLTRAKVDISALLDRVINSESGLIVYTSEPYLISPLSSDAELIKNLLPSVHTDIMPTNGDRLDRAVDMAVDKILSAGYGRGNIVIVAAETGTNLSQTLAAVRRAREKGLTVNAINVGRLHNPAFSRLVEEGNGVAVGQSRAALTQLAEQINSSAARKKLKESSDKLPVWQDYGWYCLLMPLLCCLYFFRRGVVFVILVSLFSFSAQAGFFLNDNQEGMWYFNEGAYKEAVQKFKDKKWKAVSSYRAGDYKHAVEILDGFSDTESLYNKGNAFAKGGNLAEAIKLYEHVLQENPDHEDAKYNLEYLKKQQEQQQNSQNSKKQNQTPQNQETPKNQSQQSETENEQQNENQTEKGESAQNQEMQKSQNSETPGESERNLQEENNQTNNNTASSSQNKQNLSQQIQKKMAAPQPVKEGNKDERYDETAQAREQRFREIPEDSGGLLRAFIRKTYLKNRYGGSND